MKDEKQIQTLRTFFRISTAAFEFVGKIAMIANCGRLMPENPMHVLHRIALMEIEKENPNMDYMNMLLAQMEDLATQNAAEKENQRTGFVLATPDQLEAHDKRFIHQYPGGDFDIQKAQEYVFGKPEKPTI